MHELMQVRFNIHLKESLDAETLKQIQETLYNAAVWAAEDDPEVFFEEQKNVLGVSIEIDANPLSILEAGATLGRCEEAYEKSGLQLGPTWLSVHDENGEVIASPYDPE